MKDPLSECLANVLEEDFFMVLEKTSEIMILDNAT